MAKEGTEAVGNPARVRVKVVKNKVAAPFRRRPSSTSSTARASRRGLPARPGDGARHRQEVGLVPPGDERLGQGRNNAKGYLREHPEMAQEIERRIYEALGVEPAAPALAPVVFGHREGDRGTRGAGGVGSPPWGQAAWTRSRQSSRNGSGPSTSPIGPSDRRPYGAWAPSCTYLERKRVEPAGSRRRGGRADRGGLRRRPLRPPLRRGQARARALGHGADRPRPARRPSGWGRRGGGGRRPGPRHGAQTALPLLATRFPEPPADDRERDRAGASSYAAVTRARARLRGDLAGRRGEDGRAA